MDASPDLTHRFSGGLVVSFGSLNSWVTHSPDGGGTALVSACKAPPDVVKLLLESGADPQARGQGEMSSLYRNILRASICQQEDSCLYTACATGRDDIVAVLIEHGVDPNTKGNDSPYAP
jgi:ankyrin repeat protein